MPGATYVRAWNKSNRCINISYRHYVTDMCCCCQIDILIAVFADMCCRGKGLSSDKTHGKGGIRRKSSQYMLVMRNLDKRQYKSKDINQH